MNIKEDLKKSKSLNLFTYPLIENNIITPLNYNKLTSEIGGINSIDAINYLSPVLASITPEYEKIKNVLFHFHELCNRFKLEIENQNNDTCRLFHYDHYQYRAIIVLSGPCTEYLEDDNVNWDVLGSSWTNVDEQNKKIAKDLSKVKRFNIGDFNLMLGKDARNNCKPLIHRAPDIEKSQEKRLIIKFTSL